MGQWVLCQDESDSPRSYEGRSPRNTKQQINKTVPRVEYGLRRRERSLFFFGELASSWDKSCVRTRAIILVHTKTVLPKTRSNKSTRPSLVGGFFVVGRPLSWNCLKPLTSRRLYILVYNSFWLAQVVPRRAVGDKMTEIWLLSKSCPKGRIWAS